MIDKDKLKKHIAIILMIFLIYLMTGIIHALMYDVDNYNCRHMSRDLEDFFERCFIDTKIMVGWEGEPHTSIGHMWIKIFGIQFDSVTLFPFHPELYGFSNITEWESYEDYMNK